VQLAELKTRAGTGKTKNNGTGKTKNNATRYQKILIF
jgi:hypothetical protein